MTSLSARSRSHSFDRSSRSPPPKRRRTSKTTSGSANIISRVRGRAVCHFVSANPHKLSINYRIQVSSSILKPKKTSMKTKTKIRTLTVNSLTSWTSMMTAIKWTHPRRVSHHHWRRRTRRRRRRRLRITCRSCFDVMKHRGDQYWKPVRIFLQGF